MTEPHVVVVGAGIAGLATAFRVERELTRRGVGGTVSILEAAPRVGGNIRSESVDGFTVEWGPNGFLDNVDATVQLANDLGLEASIQKADAKAATRYLWRGGELHELPSGPLSFVKSRVLSLRGRLRVLLEPFQPRGPVTEDESVRSFGARRIGAEAADVLIDAMVSGIFAGDPTSLSLPSAFPKMRAMEAEHGSLLRAMIARRRERSGGGPSGPGGTLTSFREGMATLPRALEQHFGPRLRLATPVHRIRREAGTARWSLALSNNETVLADHVVLAVPAQAAIGMTTDIEPNLTEVLGRMPSAGLAVVAVAYEDEDLAGAPDGFGFLVPRGEGIRMLGCLRDSTIFPGRAPDGNVLMRVMIGGAQDPGAVGLTDGELEDIVRTELKATLGVRAQPLFTRVIRHPHGIGQYTLGHGARLKTIATALEALPGLTLAGSSYKGVSMNSCVEHATIDAESIVERVVASTAQPERQPNQQPEFVG
jgi:protoporphyrinogen/coproporphyrinogen III oxidase